MRNFLALFVLINCSLLGGCMSLPYKNISGETICSPMLCRDVYRQISTCEHAIPLLDANTKKKCGDTVNIKEPLPRITKIVTTRLVVKPELSSKGAWIEEWEVQRNGSNVMYTVEFVPARDGGTDFAVKFPPAFSKTPKPN
jgi:hypothetical protein